MYVDNACYSNLWIKKSYKNRTKIQQTSSSFITFY